MACCEGDLTRSLWCSEMFDPPSPEENLSEARSPQARSSPFLTLVKEGEVQPSRHLVRPVNGQVQAITFRDCISRVGRTLRAGELISGNEELVQCHDK